MGRLWLLLTMPLMAAAAEDPHLVPGVPYEGAFTPSGESQQFSLAGTGGGLITVESRRSSVLLKVDDSPEHGHKLEVDRQWEWIYAPPEAKTLQVTPVDSDPGSNFTITVQPYKPEPTQSTDPVLLASFATTMNEEDDHGDQRQKARDLYERAFAAWPADEFQTEHVVALAKFADLLRNDGRYSDSLEHLQQARSLLAPADPRLKWISFSIGSMLDELGQQETAFVEFCSVLRLSGYESICKLGPLQDTEFQDRYWAASAINYIGLLHHNRGEWSAARSWYDLAMRTLPAWAESRRALIMGNIGGTAYSRGDYTTALRLIDEAQKIFEARGDKHNLASIEANKAAAYINMGQLDQAITHYQKALALEDASNTSEGQQYAERQIGRMYLTLGDLRKANESLSESYAQSSGYHNANTAYAALELGRLRRAEGNTTEAIRLHEQALDLFTRLEDPRDRLETLMQLAIDELIGLNSTGAAVHLREAEGLLPVVDNQKLMGKFRNLEGVLAAREGRFDLALAKYDEALQIQHERGDRIGEIDTSFQKSLVLETQGLLEEALALLQHTTGLINEWRLGVSSHSLRASLTGTLMDVPGKQIELLMRLDRPKEALAVVLNSRMRVLYESIAYEADATNDEQRQLVQQLKRSLVVKSEARAEFWARWFAGRDPEKVREVHRAELSRLDADIQRIKVRLDSAETELLSGRIRVSPSVSIESLQSSLTPQSVLIVFWIGEREGWRWEVTTSSIRVHGLPGRRKMEDLITAAYHDWIHAPRFPTEVMVDLASTLLSPLKLALYQDLYVIPDDLTAQVPFNALPADDGMPILASSRVTVVPAATMLEAQHRSEPTKEVALILSDPIFDTTDSRAAKFGAPKYEVQYAPLRSSHDEAIAVETVLRGKGFHADELTQYAANKPSFLSLVPSARVVHVATHGVIDSTYPLSSGLMFSRLTAEGRMRTGLLSVAEIYDLRMAADLVVLSACESGVGDNVFGEGPISLARAFLVGGAKQVIASLWRVNDATTGQLMEAFYEAWARTGSASEALRQAQLQMFSRQRWQAAKHWGAFVLVGG